MEAISLTSLMWRARTRHPDRLPVIAQWRPGGSSSERQYGSRWAGRLSGAAMPFRNPARNLREPVVGLVKQAETSLQARIQQVGTIRLVHGPLGDDELNYKLPTASTFYLRDSASATARATSAFPLAL